MATLKYKNSDGEWKEISSNMKNLKDGTALGSIEQPYSKALSPYTIALGLNNIAGCMGYYWSLIDIINNYIYLSKEQVMPEFTEEVIDPDTTFGDTGYEAGDIFSINNDFHYNFCGVIEEVINNRIKFKPIDDGLSIGFTTIKDDRAEDGNLQSDSYTLVVPSKIYLSNENSVLIHGTSHVEGSDNSASGSYSHAEGYGNIANGNFSHSEGRQNEAAYAAHSEGWYTRAYGRASHTEGKDTVSYTDYSHAEGDSTQAGLPGLIYEDTDNVAVDPNVDGNLYRAAHAEGIRSKALAAAAHAEGIESEATGEAAHAEGNSFATGDYSHAEGTGSEARGWCSHAEGDYALAYGDYSHVEGQNNYVEGYMGHAEGYLNMIWAGEKGHVEGDQNEIHLGNGGHVEGIFTAIGNVSDITNTGHAALIGDGAHTEGYFTRSYTHYSHAEGEKTEAGRQNLIDCDANLFRATHAEGLRTKAVSAAAHSEGMDTLALAQVSHAGGRGTIATGYGQTVIGTYNIPDNIDNFKGIYSASTSYKINDIVLCNIKPDNANNKWAPDLFKCIQTNTGHNPFQSIEYWVPYKDELDEKGQYVSIIGIGSSETDRRNGFTLDQNGNGWFAGDIKVGGTSQNHVNAATVLTSANLSQFLPNILTDISTITYYSEEGGEN